MATGTLLRERAEDLWAHELAALIAGDGAARPDGWTMSPRAVVTYLCGGEAGDGTPIEAKYMGDARLIEVAVAALTTDRALLLLGLPGTAKTWVGEHLAAAISGRSTLLVQGTAGLDEAALRYGWNYARLLAEGPSEAALVPSPVAIAMREGAIVRIEELTRIPSDTQDALITVLSEKSMPVPELATEIRAIGGFNVIATANDRDRGVNDLSAALRRRFATVVLPLPATLEEEIEIVRTRVAATAPAIAAVAPPPALEEIRRVVTMFRELRSGRTEDGSARLKAPSATLSTAEAIAVISSGVAMAVHFGDGTLGAPELAAGITSAVIQDPTADTIVLREYHEAVVRDRPGWADLYRSLRELV